MTLGPVSPVPIPFTLQKASQVIPSLGSDLSSAWAPIPLGEAPNAMWHSKARVGHAAIFRSLAKWASQTSRHAGRNSAEIFDGQSPLETLDALTMSQHFFGETAK
jgi:hypothetical protein